MGVGINCYGGLRHSVSDTQDLFYIYRLLKCPLVAVGLGLVG